MSNNESVTLEDCTVVKVLPNSLIVFYEGEEFQVPFSTIDDDSELHSESEVDESGTLVIPLWLAEDRGVA